MLQSEVELVSAKCRLGGLLWSLIAPATNTPEPREMVGGVNTQH